MRILRSTIACVVLLVAGSVLMADPPTWSYAHRTVTASEDLVAEYVTIAKTDAPAKTRILLEDDEGERWVIRSEGGASGTDQFSFELQSTGEVLEIEVDPTAHVKLTIGTTTVTSLRVDMEAEGDMTSATRVAAASMLGGTSQDFQDALERLCMTSTRYSVAMSSWMGPLLSMPFFPAMMNFSPTVYDVDVTPIVTSFDPNTIPPSPFAAQFGAAYYQ